MGKYLALFAAWIALLSAVDIPLDEQITAFSLKRGIEVWLKSHDSIPPNVACRFVSHNPLQGKPQIFDFDCPVQNFESDLPSFLEYCEGEIEKQGGASIGLVAVGPLDLQGLKHYLLERDREKETRQEITYEPIQLFPSNEMKDVDLCLSYPTTLPPIKSDQDLKKLWVFYLIQAMAEGRFKQAAIEGGGAWVGGGEARYLLPAIATVGHGIETTRMPPEAPKLLIRFLQAIQILKEHGFTESELADSKSKLQKHLKRFYHPSPDHLAMADYYASYLAAQLPCLDYFVFMPLSLHIISDIKMADISEMLKLSFLDETRSVAIHFPEEALLTRESIQETLNTYVSDSLVFEYQELEDVVLIEGKDPFSQLLITEDEERELRGIIETVAKSGYITLLTRMSELNKKKDRLLHIHPLRSLAVLMTDPYMRQCLSEILSDIAKGPNYISEFSRRMRGEANKKNLLIHIPGFCQTVKANPDQVQIYIVNKEYAKLIKYLLKNSN